MKKEWIMVAAVSMLIMAGCGSQKIDPAKAPAASFRPQVLVYLGGFVEKPGTYRVEFGSTYGEVVKIAGGLRPEADTTNFAAGKTVEGTVQIYIPSVNERKLEQDSVVAAESLRAEPQATVEPIRHSGIQPVPIPVYRGQTSVSLSSEEQQLLDLVNRERANKGVHPLILDSRLVKAARLKSQDMADNDYFSHESEKHGTPSELVSAQGVSYHYVGENIAVSGTVEQVHRGLMGSPGHRQNILNRVYTRVGIGIIRTPRGLIVSQEFTG